MIKVDSHQQHLGPHRESPLPVYRRFLNFYFMRVVRANLVKNGLEKYHKLVQFNQHMIVISLLMDIMIIVAMWVPSGFV